MTRSQICRVQNPDEADLLYIPIHQRNMCSASAWSTHSAAYFAQQCGIDYLAVKDVPGMWRWLLQQPSFLRSNGSDHFIITEQPYSHMQHYVRVYAAFVRCLFTLVCSD